jgi:hypothetical protein
MPVVSDEGWAAINQRRKSKRDEVRSRFRASVAAAPAKSIADFTVSPQSQIAVVESLIEKTKGIADNGMKGLLTAMQLELGWTGLGLGEAGKIATTSLDIDELMPSSLVGGHFLPPFGGNG